MNDHTHITAKEAILRERATELARSPDTGHSTSRKVQILAFMLHDETYGVELTYVMKVCRVDGLVEIPCTPEFVFGVVNLHGQIVSVIDLCVFFDLPPRGLSAMSHAVVIASDTMTIGILTDEIVGVLELTEAELQPELATFTDKRQAYLRGIAPSGMVVIDGGAILADPSLIVSDSV